MIEIAFYIYIYIYIYIYMISFALYFYDRYTKNNEIT